LIAKLLLTFFKLIERLRYLYSVPILITF
jgi:hypothetical protein